MRSIILAAALLLAAQSHAAREPVRVLVQADNPEQATRIAAECEWLSDGSVSSIGVKSALSKVEDEGRKAGANMVIVRRLSRTEAGVSYFKCKAAE
jgi:hypothetical protein